MKKETKWCPYGGKLFLWDKRRKRLRQSLFVYFLLNLSVFFLSFFMTIFINPALAITWMFTIVMVICSWMIYRDS